MKDCTTCKYGYEDEQMGFPMCHHPKRFSVDCVDFNMHEEKEIKEVKISGSSEIPKELKEASEKEYPCDKSWMTDSMLDMNAHCQVAFWKGAKWQKEQMMKNAIKGEVIIYDGLWQIHTPDLDTVLRKLDEGDKVKVIIVKED